MWHLKIIINVNKYKDDIKNMNQKLKHPQKCIIYRTTYENIISL